VGNNFDEAFKFTMFNEGGFSNIPIGTNRVNSKAAIEFLEGIFR
jgi:hypothetical protein